MAVVELAVTPQFTLDEASGLVGTRQWAVDGCENLYQFLHTVCTSGFPSPFLSIEAGGNVIALHSVTVGPFLGEPVMRQDGAQRESTTYLGNIPSYGKYLVTAQYKFQRFNDCWPAFIPKPPHLAQTVMSFRIRGSGQFLLASPNGFHMMGQQLGPNVAMTHSDNCRFIIPITEYHITCDRLTLDQVNLINPPRDTWQPEDITIPWSHRIGTVNNDTFLGMPAGTLLFDNFEVDQTFVPSMLTPTRFRLTAIIRSRTVVGPDGELLTVPLSGSGSNPFGSGASEITEETVGWNHDFKTQGAASGWVKYGLRTSYNTGNSTLRPRYSYAPFNTIFCNSDSQCLEDPCPPSTGSGDSGSESPQ